MLLHWLVLCFAVNIRYRSSSHIADSIIPMVHDDMYDGCDSTSNNLHTYKTECFDKSE